MDNFDKFYDKLNSNQKKAVDIVEGPLLILAGPGTGKTELLSVRAANIIRQKKARPENILILTYTNAAAKAVKERLVKILGPSGYDIETGTFHSFANSIILESEEAANYIQDKIQITDIEKVKALEYILDKTDGIDAIRPFRAPYTYRAEIEKKISDLKKEGITPQELEDNLKFIKPDGVYIEEKHIPRLEALACVYKLYEEYKKGKNRDLFDERGRYDFDDMIIFALEALRHEEELKKLLRQQYTYIMVDEYQDTNGAQLNLLFELLDSKRPNICCVGDDDQSIYRFQGASTGNFKALKERFPKIEIVSLKDNYRSTAEIIETAYKIIKHLPDSERMNIKELIPKKDFRQKAIEFHEFTTEAEELLYITDRIKGIKAVIEKSTELSSEEKRSPYNNIAVLVRKRDDIIKVVDAFLSSGIPYATDGKEDISTEKRVRQMIDALNLAYLKNTTDLAEKDNVFYRVITSDYLGVQLNDILKFICFVKRKRLEAKDKNVTVDITLFSQFMSAFDASDTKRPPSKKDTDNIRQTKELGLRDPYAMHRASWVIKRLIDGAQTRPVHAILMQYIDDAGVFKYILDTYGNNAILRIRELRALSSFINMVKETDVANPGIGLSDFIDEIETKKEHDMPLIGSLVTMSQEGVRVFTAHGSKGLEFHTVIIPFCLQNKSWPVRYKGESIPLPPEILKTKERVSDKLLIKELNFYDETRLFYVASTRAKSHLIYTSSPTESAISSSYLANIGLYSAEAESQVKEEPVLIRSLETTDKKDPFIGTEAVLSDLISNLTLNPTSLNNYINCKRKFLYDDVLLIPSEKKLGLTFGNCVHKALEVTYRYFLERGRFPDFELFKDAFKQELFYQGVEDSIRTACLRQLENIKEWFSQAKKAAVKPIALEKKLAVMIGDDLIFTGKYDKTEVVDEKKKTARVVDYKTGAPDEHIRRIMGSTKDLSDRECEDYFRQLVAYKLLFDRDKSQNRGFRVTEGMLVFVEPAKKDIIKYGLKKGEFINKVTALTDDMVGELESVIKKCWRSINELDFQKLPEPDDDIRRCGGCDYKNICWG